MILKQVDCVSFYVDDLDCGISFYREKLGMKLLWRTDDSCGLGCENGKTELVLVCKHNPTVSFEVENVENSIEEFTAAGGKLIYGPFDIDIGKCAVVEDLWKNRYCILDMTNGTYDVNADGNVTGVSKKTQETSGN
jgi:lactoylglutathione lyase